MTNCLPPITELPLLPETAQGKALDLLFEPSPAIHTTLLPFVQAATYGSYPELIDECRVALVNLAARSTPDRPNPTLLSVVGSHPRLGAKKTLSAQSAAEQANLQDTEEQLAQLNQEYEQRFPGLRFVVFVNGRGRRDVMHDMRVRIDRDDFAAEVDAALQAMCDIAKDRAAKLLART